MLSIGRNYFALVALVVGVGLFLVSTVLDKNVQTRVDADRVPVLRNMYQESRRRIKDWMDQGNESMKEPAPPVINTTTTTITTTSTMKPTTNSTVTTTRDRRNNTRTVLGIFTYDIEYSGPIVQGWPLDRNRSMPLYIKPEENTFFLFPTKVDLNNTKILLLIHAGGAEQYRIRRDVIRETWMTDLSHYHGFSAVFVIGYQKDGNLQKKIIQESQEYGDILQVDTTDDYWHLTIKETMAYKYALNEKWVTPPLYLIRMDDDTYLNIPELWKDFIATDIPREKYEKYIGGFVWSPASGVMRPTDPNATYVGGSVSPGYMFNGDMYPPWLSGAAYVVSFPAAKCIYSKALQLPFFHVNDVFLTGFCAELCNMPRTPLLRWWALGKKVEDIVLVDKVIHWIKDADKMREIHRTFISLRKSATLGKMRQPRRSRRKMGHKQL